MAYVETPPLPTTVLDYLGQEVTVGDIIGYSALLGRSASMSVGRVLAFQWSKPGYGKPELKIKVQGTEENWRDQKLKYKKAGFLVANYRRFVKLPDDVATLLPLENLLPIE